MERIGKFLSIFLISLLVLYLTSYANENRRKVILKDSSKDVVYLGIDKEYFNAAIGNLMGGAKDQYLALLLSQGVFEVSAHTPALVLEEDFFARALKVRILEGTFKEKTGWILMTQIDEDK